MSAGSHVEKEYIEVERIKGDEWRGGINRQRGQVREMRNKWIKK